MMDLLLQLLLVQIAVCKKVKKRRWNVDFINYSFTEKTEEKTLLSSAQCLFCPTVYGNANLSKSKLQAHLVTQHPEHQNKSPAFFESQTTVL